MQPGNLSAVATGSGPAVSAMRPASFQPGPRAVPSDAAVGARKIADARLPAGPASSAPALAQQAALDPAVVLVGCLAFALVLFLPPILNDGDTLWQIDLAQ